MAAPVPFGRYLLLEKLAVGGMAELFLAKVQGEAGFEKTCVVKRVLPHLAENPAFVEMFLDEARLAARLGHPGIVQVFDLGKVDRDYFLAMEFLAGEDLHAVLRECRQKRRELPFDLATRLIARAADALDDAHRARLDDGTPLNLVHRDISPANLFLTYQGAVKVLDFGVARAATQLRQTDVGVLKGKLPYMSPEQIRAQPVDRRTDVWALGVCLYELLTCQAPFRGATAPEVVKAVCTEPLRAPRELRAEIPVALNDAVMRALSRAVDDRFSTAGELRDALDGLLAQPGLGGPTAVEPWLLELFGAERMEKRKGLARVAVGAPAPGTERLTSPEPEATTTVELARRASRRAPKIVVAALIVGGVAAALALRPASKSPTTAPTPLAVIPPAPVAVIPQPAPIAPTPIAPAPDVPQPAPEPVAAPESPIDHGARHATTGSLSVESTSEARVLLDGKLLGTTPIRHLRVAPGRHELRVEASAFSAVHRRAIAIHAGDNQVREVFSKGSLNVDADPWADVWVDGEKLGQTPLAGRALWEGRHTVKLVGPKSQQTVPVIITGGKTSVVNIKL